MTSDSPETPLNTVAETVGEQTADAFEILGNETRLAILFALWEAMDSGSPPPEPSDHAVSFSDLKERVGMRDSGQFNYHLDKLVGSFVEQSEGGYTLTNSAEQILKAVLAGTLADSPGFEGEPIDTECYHCGGDTVIDYSDSMLTWRCISCEGGFQGNLANVYRPPVGLEGRTPQEVHRHGNTWERHRLLSMMEGVCPDCSGAVTGNLHRCDDHDTHDGTVCEECGTFWEVLSTFVCEVCKNAWGSTGWVPIFTEMAVLAFFNAHGLDVFALYDESAHGAYLDVLEMKVRATEPLEVAVTISFDDDHLTVTIDDQARVMAVTEDDGTPA